MPLALLFIALAAGRTEGLSQAWGFISQEHEGARTFTVSPGVVNPCAEEGELGGERCEERQEWWAGQWQTPGGLTEPGTRGAEI